MRFSTLTILVATIAAAAHANSSPYTGSASPCTSASSATICSVDMLDFMKSKYSYTVNGFTYTSNSDNITDSSSNSLGKTVQQRSYNVATASWSYTGSNLKTGFMKNPKVSNSLLFSPNGDPSTGYFVWDAGMDNSIYVVAEPPSDDTYMFKSFTTTNTPTVQSSWQNRGYFWSDKKMDMTPAGSGKWTGPSRITPVNGYYKFSTSGALTGVRLDGYDATGPTGAVSALTEVTYWSNLSDPNVINQFNTTNVKLPSTLEVVELKFSIRDVNGNTRFWEKYYYGRQNLGGGSFNSFGLIKFQHATRNAAVCSGGAPTPSHSSAVCDSTDPQGTLYIDSDTPISSFWTDPNGAANYVANWWAVSTSAKWKNDLKFTKRTTADAYQNIEETGARPKNRGGFKPQGAGNDSSGATILTSDWVFMENNGVDEDWYLYPNGTDPLYAPSASPTNYCRDGYVFVGAIVVPTSYNVLKYGGGIEGDWATTKSGDIGTYVPSKTGSSNHWLVMCSTLNTSGTGQTAYINATNSGEASCAANYTTRLWFNANHTGVTACPTGSSCFDGSAKNYVNFCVKTAECVGSCAATSNP